MSNRKVTLYSTKGGKHIVETNATTWGDLKPLVAAKYDLANLQATENIGKTTLEHLDATLPEGDFILFLRPIKTKSGNVLRGDESYSELRSLVSNDNIKAYLNSYISYKNWTQFTTGELRRGLKSYFDSNNLKQDSVVAEELPATNDASYEILSKLLYKVSRIYDLLEREYGFYEEKNSPYEKEEIVENPVVDPIVERFDNFMKGFE